MFRGRQLISVLTLLPALSNLSCGSSVQSESTPCAANAKLNFLRTYVRPIDSMNSSTRSIHFKKEVALAHSQAMTWKLTYGPQTANFDSPVNTPADEAIDVAGSQVIVSGQSYDLFPLSHENEVSTYAIHMKTKNYLSFKKNLEAKKTAEIAQFCQAESLSSSRLIVDNKAQTATFRFSLSIGIRYTGHSPEESLKSLASGLTRPLSTAQGAD